MLRGYRVYLLPECDQTYHIWYPDIYPSKHNTLQKKMLKCLVSRNDVIVNFCVKKKHVFSRVYSPEVYTYT